MYFLKHNYYVFCFLMRRMKRTSRPLDLAKFSVMNRPDASTRARADPMIDTWLRRLANPSDETSSRLSTSGRYDIDMGASRCASVCGTASKTSSTRNDSVSISGGYVASRDSIDTTNSAVYYTPPNAPILQNQNLLCHFFASWLVRQRQSVKSDILGFEIVSYSTDR